MSKEGLVKGINEDNKNINNSNNTINPKDYRDVDFNTNIDPLINKYNAVNRETAKKAKSNKNKMK